MKNLLRTLVVALITSTAFSQTARVQVIHNSADAAAATVDVYLDATLLLDDFDFRTASPFVDAPAGVEIDLSVAPGNSTGVGDAIYTATVTLTADETYVVLADGIVSASGYNPSPAFGLQIYDMGREAATIATNVDVLVHHGSTDAPTVDVVETGVGVGTIVDDISYTEFQGYLELPTADYVIEVRDETGTAGVAAYSAPLETLMLDGAALTVVASGFLDPSQNSNGPAFGLYVASPAGGPLLALPTAPLGVADFNRLGISIYPNPTSDRLNIVGDQIDFADYRIMITDMLGRVIVENSLQTIDNSIDVNSLNNGVYQINILDGTRVLAAQKFIKR